MNAWQELLLMRTCTSHIFGLISPMDVRLYVMCSDMSVTPSGSTHCTLLRGATSLQKYIYIYLYCKHTHTPLTAHPALQTLCLFRHRGARTWVTSEFQWQTGCKTLSSNIKERFTPAKVNRGWTLSCQPRPSISQRNILLVWLRNLSPCWVYPEK